MQVTYSPLLQVAQIVYWLALSTWFGGVLFIGLAAPIIFRVVQEGDPLLPSVLSVNLEGQHSTLLAGSIVSELISVLMRIGWVCAAVLLPALLVQAFLLSASHAWVTILRCVLYCLTVLVLLYQWRVLVPKTAAARKQYIDHADEPEIANPAKDQFDRYHQESVNALMILLFLLLGLVLFSASSLLPFAAIPTGRWCMAAEMKLPAGKKWAERRQCVQAILPILKKTYPTAKCSLDHRTPLQLLVATILSAQSTDVRVNLVTPGLFKKYPDAQAFASASQEELESDIRSTGFFRSKAKALRAMARSLVSEHGGQVPQTIEALTGLAGVGRKTANVVLGNAFGQNIGVVVDTHVTRLANRLGLTDHASDAVKIEQDLMRIVPREDWALWSHLLIYHGRAICMARSPACEKCPIFDYCPTGPKILGERNKPAQPRKKASSAAVKTIRARGSAAR